MSCRPNYPDRPPTLPLPRPVAFPPPHLQLGDGQPGLDLGEQGQGAGGAASPQLSAVHEVYRERRLAGGEGEQVKKTVGGVAAPGAALEAAGYLDAVAQQAQTAAGALQVGRSRYPVSFVVCNPRPGECSMGPVALPSERRPMPFVACPGCHRKIELAEEELGLRVECAKCGKKFLTRASQLPPTALYIEQNSNLPPMPTAPEPPSPASAYVAPHRSAMLLPLAIFGLILSIVAMPLAVCGACIPGASFLACLICMPITLAAWLMAWKDLGLMNQGRMDPAGRGSTQVAAALGVIGSVLGSVGAVVTLLWVLLIGTAAAIQTGPDAPPRRSTGRTY